MQSPIAELVPPSPPDPEPRERFQHATPWAARVPTSLVAGTLFGLAIRLWLAKAGEGKTFSDNAVVALMAMHALRGRFYTFYWGQSYMGSLEAIVIAPFFALFGASDFTLSAGLLPWYVLSSAAIYFVTALCGGQLAAAVAVWLAALAPSEVQFYEITARGGYPATLAFGAILVWLALRIVYRPLSATARRRHLLWIGAVAGLAFWTNWLVFPYYAVTVLYLLTSDPRLPLRRETYALGAAFFAGSAPLWIFYFRHGLPGFLPSGAVDAPTYGERLRWVFGIGLPNVLGLRDLHGVFAFGAVGRVLLVITALAACAAFAGPWRSWRALMTGRIERATPALALVLLAVATIGVYVLGLPSRFQIGRYLLPFHSAAVPLMALGVAWLWRKSRLAGALVLSGIFAFYGAELVRFHREFRAPKGRYIAGPIENLAEHLLRSGIRYGYADYGDAALTTYFTEESVILADYEERYYPRDEVAFRDAAIVVRDGGLRVDTTLAAIDASARVSRIPGYTIYWPIRYDGVPRKPLSRSAWKATSNVPGADPSLAIDGDAWTYWTAPPLQTAAPTLTLDLGSEETFSGLFFDLGRRDHDWFHRLRIERSTDLVKWQLVREVQWDLFASFDREGQVTMRTPGNLQLVLFPPRDARGIRLTLLANNPGFDWTIGELDVFGVGEGSQGLEPPSHSDPRSAPLKERRLRRELANEPASNRAMLELERLYADSGETSKLSEIIHLEREAFTPTVRLGWQFGREIRLVGYDWMDSPPGRRRIAYYWQALRRTSVDAAVSVHFDRPGFRFQDDFYPGAPRHGTSQWQPGEIVKVAREITIPANAPPGPYAVKVGVWEPQTRRRLYARLGCFRTAKERALGTIRISENEGAK